jgi:predicted O-methyltransferase YrrM
MKTYTKEFTKDEILALIEKYYKAEGYHPDMSFEHRCDVEYSEQIYYSLVRDYQPTSCLEFGGSHGGSVCVNLAALDKNGKPYQYVVSEKFPDILDECTKNVTSFANDRGIKQLPTFVGAIEDNLDKVPEKLDYLFIDTNHDEENCKWYLKNIFPRLVDGALVHIHDWAIKWGPEKKELIWQRNPNERAEAGEIQILLDMFTKHKLPLVPLYWTWGDGVRTALGGFEEAASSFWIYYKK